MMNVCKFETIDELNKWAADFICNSSDAQIKEKGFFTIALSGGSSPAKLYALLASSEFTSKLNWEKIYIFWGDERFVDRYDDDSNYKMVYEQLISKAHIRMSQIFAVPVSGLTPTESAVLYERQIKNLFREKRSSIGDDVPSFDIVLLGMGGDGHTASLFPNSPLLYEEEKLVVATNAPDYAPSRDRITFTFKLINKAKDIILLVPGKEKTKLIKKLVSEDSAGNKMPAQLVRNNDHTYLLIDNDYS